MSQKLEEKVARALAPYGIRDRDLEAAARAALAVVREEVAEPTPGMIEFGEDSFDRNGDSLAVCWRAMLSASPLGEPNDKP